MVMKEEGEAGASGLDWMEFTINLSSLQLCAQFNTASPIKSVMIFEGSCSIGNFMVTNGGVSKWIMFFDTETSPQEGDIPKFRLPLKEGGVMSITGPIIFRYGLYVAASASILHLDQAGIAEDLHIFSQIYSRK